MNDANAKELRRRERKTLPTAQAVTTSSAQVQSVQDPSKFADDLKRIECEMNAEDLEVRKPTVKDKLRAAATNTYQCADIAEAKRFKDQMDRRLALECIKRRARKASKRMLK